MKFAAALIAVFGFVAMCQADADFQLLVNQASADMVSKFTAQVTSWKIVDKNRNCDELVTAFKANWPGVYVCSQTDARTDTWIQVESAQSKIAGRTLGKNFILWKLAVLPIPSAVSDVASGIVAAGVPNLISKALPNALSYVLPTGVPNLVPKL